MIPILKDYNGDIKKGVILLNLHVMILTKPMMNSVVIQEKPNVQEVERVKVVVLLIT